MLLIDYDGHHQATATAEFLAELGKTVHVITSSLFVGSELGPSQDLYLTRQRLLQKGVTFTPDFAVMEIKHPETGAEIHGFNVYSNVWDVISGYDSIVTAMGNDADDAPLLRPQGHDGRPAGWEPSGAPAARALPGRRLRGAAQGGHGHPRRLHGREARVSGPDDKPQGGPSS